MSLGSPEDVWMDGRLQDEDDEEQRKQQNATQREQSHLEHLPTVGAEREKHSPTFQPKELQL